MTEHKTCRVCKGGGELRSSHPEARRYQGYELTFRDPYGHYAREGGTSGEIVAEETRSICGGCRGCGIKA